MKKKTFRSIALAVLICITMTAIGSGTVPVAAQMTVSSNEALGVEVPPVQTETTDDVTVISVTGLLAGNQVSENAAAKTEIGQVTGVSAKSASYRTMKISYNAVYGAKGYEIYRGTNKKDMAMIADLSAVRTDYTDKGDGKAYLTLGKRYYYKVRAYVLDEDGQKQYGAFSDIVSAKTKLSAPAISMAEVRSYKSIKITYGKVSGANGYVIYRSTKADSGFKKIGTVKKKKVTEFTDSKCKTGVKYYYKVRAYRTVNGKKKYSGYSEAISVKTKLNTPKLRSVTVTGGDTALLTWKKVSGASGYYIYRCDTQNGTYKRVLKVKSGKTTQAYVDGHENGKTYYYKVRAYRVVDKKKKFSAYSNIKNAVFNLLASADETYQDKAQRIFGLPYYKKYATKEEADRHMKTITVDVWDFAADGVTKVTKQRTLVVHENIAATVQQIFKEIYEGQERFPIKNVSGYTWRGETSESEHCCGVAIDINWEENYLIDNGVIISGKCYQPGINPYSIPTNGEVAKIMNKYGFTQGIWGNRCDYMHFSYFGT